MQSVVPRLRRCAVCGFLLPLSKTASDSHAPTLLPAGAPLATGALLRDRYRLVELIGQGAHGLTFLAHHEFLNHPCVVKVLPHRIRDGSDGAVQRLRNEASAGFRVNHTNVVRVLDGDAVEGIWYFVMEYVDGVDLGTAVDTGTLIDWRQALRFAIDATHGLDAIHHAGLVHRDIKPANLILGTDGRVRIADLGVARLIQEHPGFASLANDAMAGTLPYAAPELFTPGAPVGPQTDLYSLGATLFELVTGVLPRGASLYRTLMDAHRDPVRWPGDVPSDVPAWFSEAILRLLETAPENRFDSSATLAKHLQHPSERSTASIGPAEGDYPEPRGLAVLPFENASEASGDAWLGHALADHLARSLALLPGLYVADLDQFLQTLGRVRQRSPGRRAQQLLEAGRLSGAATVIEGAFRRSGEAIELSVHVYQSATAEPSAVEPVRGALAALADLESELLARLGRLLGLAPAATKPEAPGRNLLAAEERFFTAKRAFLRGDYEAAMRLGKEAVDLDPKYGEALGLIGACYARTGRYDQAAEYNRRQEILAAREGDERLKVQAQANMGSMHYFRGEYPAANDCLARAAETADRLRMTTELAQIRNNLGFVLLQLGRQAEAGETFLRAVAMLKKYGVLVALIGPYNGLGHVCREQKRYEEARGYFRRALALAQESDDDVNMGVAYMNLGHCALLQGCLADAKHELVIALNILEQTSFWNGLARVYEYMADLNLRLSNWPQAIRCADKRIELAQRHSNLRMESAAWRQKAEALQLAGRLTEADACRLRVSNREALA